MGDVRFSRQAFAEPREPVHLHAELTRAVVQRCEAELWFAPMMHVDEDGSGVIGNDVVRSDIPFYTEFFIGLGNVAVVQEPAELKESIRRRLSEMLVRYQ